MNSQPHIFSPPPSIPSIPSIALILLIVNTATKVGPMPIKSLNLRRLYFSKLGLYDLLPPAIMKSSINTILVTYLHPCCPCHIEGVDKVYYNCSHSIQLNTHILKTTLPESHTPVNQIFTWIHASMNSNQQVVFIKVKLNLTKYIFVLVKHIWTRTYGYLIPDKKT